MIVSKCPVDPLRVIATCVTERRNACVESCIVSPRKEVRSLIFASIGRGERTRVAP